MTWFKNFIGKQLKGYKVLYLFLLTNVVYFFMILVTIPKLTRMAGGMKILDMMPTGYSEAYVKGLLAALGPDGRSAYLWEQIPLDLVFPLLFGVSYCLLQAFILKKLGKFHEVYFYLCLLPVLAGLADYMENLGIILLLTSYPNLANFTINWTQIFTLTKSILSSLFYVGLIISLILWVVRYFKHKRFSGGKFSQP